MNDWSYRNDMRINPQKAKKMAFCFCKEDDHHANIHPLVIDGTIIERVPHAKVLGVTKSANLCWNVHVENIVSKASKHMYMLYQVEKAGSEQKDLLKIYLSVSRPVLEYACPVWHPHLPKYLSDSIEHIQKKGHTMHLPREVVRRHFKPSEHTHITGRKGIAV